MTLKEALEEVIAHPRKRALKWGDTLLYFDDTWDPTGLLTNTPGGGGFGFGYMVFSVYDATTDKHVVVDVDFESFLKIAKERYPTNG